MSITPLMPVYPRCGVRPVRGEHCHLIDEDGTRYLDFLLERFDQDLAKVLAAYNSGEGTVDRYGGVPPYRETREYVKRIFGILGLETVTAQLAPAGVARASR